MSHYRRRRRRRRRSSSRHKNRKKKKSDESVELEEPPASFSPAVRRARWMAQVEDGQRQSAAGRWRQLTPNFHWIRVAALRLRSSFAPQSGNPHRLCFESTAAQSGRLLAQRLSSSRDNHMITHDRSYRSVLLKTTTGSVPTEDQQKNLCLFLF